MDTIGARTELLLLPIDSTGVSSVDNESKDISLDAVSMRDAWRLYDELLSDLHVVFAVEPAEVETKWRSLTQSALFSTNVWADAYLAAFAQVANFEIVTFDKGFAQYKNLQRTILA